MSTISQNKNKFLILPSTTTSTSTIFVDTSYEKLSTGLGPSPSYGYQPAFDSQRNLYVVGQFTTAGGVSVNNIAKWDGSSWSNVGGGTNGYLLSIYIDPSDNIYVGGQFSRCDPTGVNLAVRNIAKWDGSAWSDVGGGTNGSVFSINKNNNGDILVGGSFTSVGIGGTLLSTVNISSWNGSSWFNYAGGIGINFAGDLIRKIIVLQNKIYVCGRFTSTNTVPAIITNNIAMWDGSWNALGLGLNGDTYTMVTNGIDKIYCAGGFSTAGGIPTNSGLAVYNVNTLSWSTLPPNGFGSSLDIEIDQLENLYVSGNNNYIRKFNGTIWSNAATGFNNFVREMVIISNGIDLYVTGFFTMINSEVYNYVAKIIVAHNETITTTRSSIILLPLTKKRFN